MNWLTVGMVAVVCFLAAVGVGVIYAALVAGSRADDDMEAYWRDQEDPPTGI